MVSLVVRIRNLWNRSPFLSPKKRAHYCTVAGEKRHESTHAKNASTIWKKNDAAHAAAKFVFIV